MTRESNRPSLSVRPARTGEALVIVELHAPEHVSRILEMPPVDGVARGLRNPSLEHHLIFDNTEPVGFVLLARVAPWLYEIRHMVAKHEARGIGSFALRWALERIFDEHGAHRAYLEVHAGNVRARSLYERFGFVYEGAWREGARNPITGGYEDLCIYGLLETEYREMRRGRP